MKIWLINHYAVPPKYYPLARQYNFARCLLAKGHEVIIFAASTVHNSDINLISDDQQYIEVFEDGIHYVLIYCRHYQDNGMKRIKNMYEFAWKLPKVCANFNKPDVIISTSMPPMSCAAGIKIAKKFRCKAIAEIADLWPESIIAYGIAKKNNPAVFYLRRMEKWIYKNADKVIFTMEGAYEYIKEQKWENVVPQDKVFTINNGVDLELFEYNKMKYQIDDEDLNNTNSYNIVYTGSIRKVNNVGLILEVAKNVKNDRIKFLIWGKGDELEYLNQRVHNEKINNVIFKGNVEKKYVPYIVSNAHINYMHGEYNDLFRFGISPNKLFDYFAAKKPVFCDFSCNYNPVITSEAGIDVNSIDPVVMAHALDKFVEISKSDYERMCVNSFRAAQKYSFEHLSEKILEIIEA